MDNIYNSFELLNSLKKKLRKDIDLKNIPKLQ